MGSDGAPHRAVVCKFTDSTTSILFCVFFSEVQYFTNLKKIVTTHSSSSSPTTIYLTDPLPGAFQTSQPFFSLPHCRRLGPASLRWKHLLYIIYDIDIEHPRHSPSKVQSCCHQPLVTQMTNISLHTGCIPQLPIPSHSPRSICHFWHRWLQHPVSSFSCHHRPL